MKVLHILNDGPSDDATPIIERQSDKHDVRVIDLSQDDIDYDALVEQIEQCDRVFSW